jgi:hypothetical protein
MIIAAPPEADGCEGHRMSDTRALALISAIAAALWLGIIAVLHLVMPRLDARTHMLSEYAREPGGWTMQLAFFSMALSCLTLEAAARPRLPPLGPLLLIACGIGFAGAGAFVTDPVLPTQRTQSRSGALHVVMAFFVIVLFPVMATVVGFGLTGTPLRLWLIALSILTWAGFIGFLGAAFYSTRHAGTPLGYFQRFMVVTYSVWLIATGLMLAA